MFDLSSLTKELLRLKTQSENPKICFFGRTHFGKNYLIRYLLNAEIEIDADATKYSTVIYRAKHSLVSEKI